jgi:hypothetical protein
MAAAFGTFLAIGETVRNWGNWQWWPFWLVDYIAATLLVCAAILTLRRAGRGPVFLAGSWGFTTAMFYMSFWSHIEQYHQPADGNIAQAPLTIIIGVLWAVTIAGFVLSLVSTRDTAARRGASVP